MTETKHWGAGGAGRTVVFLDIDRVLSPVHDTEAWADTVRVENAPLPNVYVSPTLLGRVGALDADLVFVSDWEELVAFFEPWLGRKDVPYLRWLNDYSGSGWWKRDAIAAYLSEHSDVTRIVVADDHLPRPWMDGSTNASNLITAIRPDMEILLVAPEDGLTANELEAIETFVNRT